MTEKTFSDAEHIIRHHHILIDEALESAFSEAVRRVASEMGGAKSNDQVEEIENAVLSRMRIWAGSKLGAI